MDRFRVFGSIGSLGKDGKREEVEAINIRNCTFNRTNNGVRIKTWQVTTSKPRQLINEFLKVRKTNLWCDFFCREDLDSPGTSISPR